MKTSELNGVLTISVKNKPFNLKIYILLSSTLCLIIYSLLSNQIEWALISIAFFLLIFVVRLYTLNYKIIFSHDLFEIQKTILGIKYSNIKCLYSSYVFYENGTYFYLYNQSQRISVIYGEDLEIDYLEVSEEKGKSIAINSNEESRTLFNRLSSKLRPN
jgi:hypothetical protein